MLENYSLKGKNIVVTGSGQGIGERIAEVVVELGGNAIAVDVKPEGIEALAERKGKDRVLPSVTDVTDPAQVQKMIDAAVAKFGAVHGLVNNAAIVKPAMIHKMTPDQWRDVINVDLNGVFFCLQGVVRHMLDRFKAGDTTPGAIVNIASEAGRAGVVGQINYGAAKAGLCGITASSARELARYNIRVNTVAFGPVDTPMTQKILTDPTMRARTFASIALGRLGSRDEVSLPVCFLLSDASTFITGQTLGASGGCYIST